MTADQCYNIWVELTIGIARILTVGVVLDGIAG